MKITWSARGHENENCVKVKICNEKCLLRSQKKIPDFSFQEGKEKIKFFFRITAVMRQTSN